MSPSRRVWLAITEFLTDPPGWIPAWWLHFLTTAVAIWTLGHPDAMPVLLALIDLEKITLVTWLGYKGSLAVIPAVFNALHRRPKTEATTPPAGTP